MLAPFNLRRRSAPTASGFSGTPTPYTPAPAAGATMTPPVPYAPTAQARATPNLDAAGVVPMAPVTTAPMSNFRLSLNTERANTAAKAATFAAGSPLPMTSDGQYNGSYGSAEQAQAARQAFVDQQHKTIDQQDLGPGIGINSYTNAGLVGDANARLNQVTAEGGPPKEQLMRSQAEKNLAAAAAIPLTTDAKNQYLGAQTKAAGAKADQTTAMTPGLVQKTAGQAKATTQRADAATQQAATGAAREQRQASQNPNAYKAAAGNAHDEVATAMATHQSIRTMLNAVEKAAASAVDPAIAKNLAGRVASLRDEEMQARTAVGQAQQRAAKMRTGAATPAAPATPPAATATTQPSGPAASAVQATHQNPQTGQKIGWDGQQWVQVA